MDWTSLTGHRRPVEPEALRLLTVVHQLGQALDGDDRVLVRRLVGESTLLQLDHLVLKPRLLAHLLIHLYDIDESWTPRRSALARRVRQLLEMDDRRRVRPLRGRVPSHLDFPPVARWRRLDDVLATASSRDLLRLDMTEQEGTPEIAYGVTRRGAELLETHVFTEGPEAARQLEICSVVREFLPRWDGPWLQEQLEDAAISAYEFRTEEQIPRELSLLPELFHAVLHERL